MSTLNREINLYIDGDLPGGRNALLSGLTDPGPATERPALMQGDILAVNLYFRRKNSADPVGSVTTALELPAGSVVVLAGKLESDLSGDALFVASSFASGGSSDTVHYAASLTLNTDAIQTAFEANPTSSSLNVFADVEVQNAGNTERVTFRLHVTLYRQAYQGDEATPVPSPSYRIVSGGGIVFELSVTDDGQLQVERV